MKRILIYVLAAPLIILAIPHCSDKGGGGGGTDEANLTITLNPPANSVQPAAPQVDFPLSVTITSAMPPQGVTIDVRVAPDGSSSNFFTENRTSSSANNSFTITGTPVGVVSVTTVTVTSKTKASNTVTASYRYSRKI